jgi:NAD(P)-dependent dehydrogenase (short-subunit alcohol dehydrogenase family)
MKTLENKVIAITGAASGIGLAISERCIALGARVAIADIDKPSLQQVLSDQNSKNVLRTTIDVSNERSVQQWAMQVFEHFGRIDAVINNAGISLSRTVCNMSREQLQRVMDINFYGVVNGVNAFLPYLQQRDDSHIVNVSSLFGLIGVPTQSAYNAAKFAVRGFTEALCQEMAGTNLNVSCVLPGGVKTNIVKSGEHFDAVDGQSTSTKELSQQFDKTARTTPIKAAQVIVRGILNNKKRILIGSDAKFIDLIQRLLPSHYDRILKPISLRQLKRLSGGDTNTNPYSTITRQ